jgi:hypothetical protein
MARTLDVSTVGEAEGYLTTPKTVAPIGLVKTPDDFNMVKAYQMFGKRFGPFDRGYIERVKNFIRGDTGLGFTILSDGFLNISM